VVKRARKPVKGRSPIFYGCSRYPECDFTSSEKPTGERCPACGDLLVETSRGAVRCRNSQCGWRGARLEKAS
jgi:DNA topoisomerase-1